MSELELAAKRANCCGGIGRCDALDMSGADITTTLAIPQLEDIVFLVRGLQLVEAKMSS
jgi:hypothetical protein